MTITKLTAILALAAAQLRAADAGGSIPPSDLITPPLPPAQQILVSITDRKLALFENGRLVKVYDVAVGKASTPSPVGRHRVVTRVENPTWYAHGKAVPPGKANPLGTRWIGLSAKSYGIHGTNVPRSIGKAASHGCIRMRNQDVEELFSRVQAGAEVELLEDTPRWTELLLSAVIAEAL